MGAWGYGIFQSDQELDVMEEITDEARKLAKNPDFDLWYPENHKDVVTELNAGVFHQLLVKFVDLKWNHGVVYLAALTMQLGATINDTDMQTIRDTLPHTPMYDEAKGQMQKGINEYKSDGKPWDFESMGLHETMASDKAGNQPGSLGNLILH